MSGQHATHVAELQTDVITTESGQRNSWDNNCWSCVTSQAGFSGEVLSLVANAEKRPCNY